MKKNLWAIGALVLTLSSPSMAFAAQRPTASEFPDKTIIIGTYAIALEALNDEIYAVATASADKSGQEKIYFKSDINKGTWYDITDSTQISQISVTQDNLVPNQTIEDLPLRYYTQSNGQTIDFTTGETVSIAEMSELTDPPNMQEMEELVTELDIQNSIAESSEDDQKEIAEEKVDSLETVLAPIGADGDDKALLEQLDQLRNQIASMESSIQAMQVQGASATALSIATEEKMALETQRDAICYDIVYARMDAESQKLNQMEHGDLLEKYATAMSNIKETQTEMGVPTSTDAEETQDGTEEPTGAAAIPDAAEKMEEQISAELQAALTSEDLDSIMDAITKKEALQGIQSNNAAVSDEMLQMQNEMLAQMKEEAKSSVSEKMSAAAQDQEYAQATQNGTSQATLDKMLADMSAEVMDSVNDVLETDDKSLERITDPVQKVEILEDTAAYLEQLAEQVPAILQEEINQQIAQLQQENKAKLDAVKLETVPSYQALQTSLENLKQTIEDVYDAYMGQVEENDMDAAAAMKNQIDVLTDVKETTQAAIVNMEQSVADGSVAVDVNTGKMEENEKGKELKEAANQAVNNNAAAMHDAKAAMTQAEQLADNTISDNSTESVSSDVPAEALEAGYTEAEAKSLSQAAENMGEGYLPPWKLIFQEMQVKLYAPIYISGNEVYVPAEDLAAQLGISVIRSRTNGAVVLRKSGGIIEYIPNDAVMYVNDKRTQAKPAPSVMYGGKVYIPLSAFERAFGYTEVRMEDTIVVSKK